LYEKTNGKIWIIVELYQNLIEKRGMGIDQVVNAVDTSANKLPYMEDLHRQIKEEVNKLRGEKLYLLNEVDFLTAKISNLQQTVCSLEQNCKRIEGSQGTHNYYNDEEIAKMLVANFLNQIQTLVNSNISSSISSSYNPTLSLPSQSSSSDTLPVRFNQSRSYRKQQSEEIEEMHKGDIAE
jgi:hypothetical protein